MKQVAGTYTFQELTTQADLLATFKLRLTVYQQARSLRQLLTPNALKSGLDIDGYDAYARHYGIFQQTNDGANMLIGSLRVISQEKNEWAAAIIAEKEAELDFKVPPRPKLFMCEKKFPNAAELLQMPLDATNFSIAEPSRFVILPAYRSVGLAQFIIRSISLTICAMSQFECAVLFCQIEHCAMYRRNGFTWVAKEERAEHGKTWHLMVEKRADANRIYPNLPQILEKYRIEGKFHHQLAAVDWSAWRYLLIMGKRLVRRLNLI